MTAQREETLKTMLAGAATDPPKNATEALASATHDLAKQNTSHLEKLEACGNSLTLWRALAALGFGGWAFFWWRHGRKAK